MVSNRAADPKETISYRTGGGLGSWALGKLRAGGQDGGLGVRMEALGAGTDVHLFVWMDVWTDVWTFGRLDGHFQNGLESEDNKAAG